MSFTAVINGQGNFTASVNGSAVFNVSMPDFPVLNVGMAAMGPSGLLTADAPLIYDSVLKNISIDLSDYATLAYVDSTFQPISEMSAYLTVSDAAATYQTLAGMSAYATLSYTNSQLALKLDKPTVGPLDTQILAYDATLGNVWIDNYARSLFSVVRNETGAPLPKGSIVYIQGASGNKPLVQKAIASTEMGSSRTFAILAQDIQNQQNGNAITVGELTKVNTFGLPEGVGLWLSPTVAGTWTTTKPTAPNHAVFIGNVIRAHQNQGVVEVRIQNGYELDELHDVAVLDRANNDVLVYESSTSLWKSKTISEILGYTPLQPSDLNPYLTAATAAATYYPLTNPTGYITSAALSPYLLSSTAASTYQTISGMSAYATDIELSAVQAALQGEIDGKQPAGDYATNTALTNGLATKQPVGDYATNTALTDGLATKANTVHTHTIQQVDGLETELDGKQPVGDYATNAALTDGLATKANVVHTHDASDIVSGVLDISRIPVIPSQVQVFAAEPDITQLTQAEQDQITGAGVIVVLSNGERWMYKGTGSKTDYASYVKIGDITPDWSDITNKPSEFPPSAHTHPISDIDGLQTALDGKNPLLDQSLNTTDHASFANITTSSITILDGGNDLIIDESGILFTDGTLQSTAGVSPSSLSTTLADYLTISSASATYQTLTGMSSYLTTAAADATYYPITNPSGYITSSALSGYATESWVTTNFAPAGWNPFNQTLNTGDFVQFNQLLSRYVHATDTGASFPTSSLMGAWSFSQNKGIWIDTQGVLNAGQDTTGGYISITGTGITFGDGTTQSTAATVFDQPLNTIDSPSFVGLTTNGGDVTLYDNQSPASVYQFKWDSSTAIAGIYAGAIPIVELTSNGIAFGSIGASLTFSDGTVQTTAATTPDLSGYAEKAVANTFTANQVISVTDNSNPALRVTQLGTGEAFRVEDSANPDSTPFVITATGQVGIGTTTVGSNALHVSGNVFFANNLNVGGNTTLTVSSGTGVPLTIQNNGTGNSFVVNDEAGDTSPFVITADGNVGIGRTPTAGYKLDVAGNLVVAGSVHSLTLSSQGLQLTQVSGSAASFTINNSGTGASFRVNDEASDTTPFIVDAGGNVGVKRASPAYDLDVNGTVNLSTLRFGDGTTMTTAVSANPFDQDLNTTDSVQFQKTNYASATTGYETITAEAGVELSEFPAGFQVKDSSSGTTSTVSLSGFSTTNGSGTFASVEPSTLASQGSGGVYVAIGSSLGGLYIYDPSTGGGAFGFTSNGLTFSNGTTQTKAYPFSGAVATAIEGGLIAANAPSDTNAFATLGDVESSVNAYAASVTPVLPTTDEKAAMANANTPSGANPFLTAAALTAASESQSGIIELANLTEAEAASSTTLATSPARVRDLTRRLLLKRGLWGVQAGLTTQVTGTGASYSQLVAYSNAGGPNAGIAGFSRAYTILNTSDPAHIASSGAYINFSKAGGFGQAIYLFGGAAYSGTRFQMIMGEANSPTAGVVIGDPTGKRIGMSYTVGGQVQLMVHNGTTLEFVNSGYTPPSVGGAVKVYIEVDWDGLGNAYLYLKTGAGVEYTCSSSNAPTGAPQSIVHSSYMLQISTTGAHTLNSYNCVPSHPFFYFE